MSRHIRIRPHALAAALALFFFAASDAGAQCLITGASSLCNGPVQLCGPAGNYEYEWLDPSGNYSFYPCLTASEPGVYSLVLYDIYGGSFGPCTVSLGLPEPPACAITGPASACAGSTVELCGPQGDFSYAWSGPNGFAGSAACVQVSVSGTYALTLRNVADACVASTCEHAVRFESPEPPACAITGPASACAGSPVELCGPQGDFSYAWSGPSGFTSSAACVQVSVGGTYVLTLRSLANACVESVCEHPVAVESCHQQPLENCPKPAWFWMRQCLAAEPSGHRLAPSQLAALAARVDAGARIFDWSDASAEFCATLHPRPATLRARAKRQFAAVHANVCAGEMGLPAVEGHAIALDPATRVQVRDVSTTVGAWLASTDARLCELEALDRNNRAAKEAYRQIIRAGWHINHGRGMGPVCGRSKPQRDVDDDSAALEGEGNEPLAAELADDEEARPEIAKAMPNPFSVATTLTYVVSGASSQEVAIAVYDLSGRMVRELARGSQAPGVHEARWDGVGANGARVRSGVYFVRGMVGSQRIAGQLTVLR